MQINKIFKLQRVNQDIIRKAKYLYEYLCEKRPVDYLIYQEMIFSFAKNVTKELVDKVFKQNFLEGIKGLQFFDFLKLLYNAQIIRYQQTINLKAIPFTFYTQQQFFIAGPLGITNAHIQCRNYKKTILETDQGEIFKKLVQGNDITICRYIGNRKIDTSQLFNWLAKCIKNSTKSSTHLQQSSYSSHQKCFNKGFQQYIKAIQSQKSVYRYIYNHYIQESQFRNQALELCGWERVNCKFKYDYLPTAASTRNLAIHIFHFHFEGAFKIAQKLQNLQQIKLIRPLLYALKDIQNVIQNDTGQLQKRFFDRNQFKINFQNLLESISGVSKQYARVYNVKQQWQFATKLFKQVKSNDPYLQLISQFLGNMQDRKHKGWEQLLTIKGINISDKFAFAFKFMPKYKLMQFTQNFKQKYCNEADLNSIIVFGPSQTTIQILQNYVDKYNDLQLVAILSIIFRTLKYPQTKTLDLFINTYIQNLKYYGFENKKKQFKLQYIEFQKKLNNNQSALTKSSIYLKCVNDFCDGLLFHKGLERSIDQKKPGYARFLQDGSLRLSHCPHCVQVLPCCCICLLPISIANPYLQLNIIKRSGKQQNKNDSQVDGQTAIVWCNKCKHGGHYNHLIQWFSRDQKCPVIQCACNCIYFK